MIFFEEKRRSGLCDAETKNTDGLFSSSFDCLNKIKSRFSNFISHINGEGLLAAILFNDESNMPLSNLCDTISEKCLQKGLLVVHTGRESIKLAPPLNINIDALNEGIQVLEEAIEESINEAYGN